jgi:hypothetical protein
MSDVGERYCQHEQEICHDDGYGYDEDENEQYCTSCNKEFIFITSVSFSYSVYCSTYNDHDFAEVSKHGYEQCKNCEYYESL